ncbi:LOW QUALITY PROTEIN: glycine N-acyltransferase-like protein 3 [Chlamydotis macqueenii]
MLILTHPSQLRCLEGALRRSLPSPCRPFCPQVYGAVLNINRGNPGEFEVAVDAWPNFGAVLARSGEMPVDDCYRNMHAAFYRDAGAYPLLESPGCLRWDSAFHIFGLQDEVATASQAIAGRKGVELEVTEYHTYWHPDPAPCPSPGEPPPHPAPPPAPPPNPSLTAPPPPRRRLDPGLRTDSLSPADADLLNETWAYGGNGRSRRYLAELLGRFRLCLRDQAGDPVCWVLTDAFGTGANGYTLPAHRRRGYMQAVLSLAAGRSQARGFPAFGHTATGNRGMQRLQEELGYQRLPGLCRFVLHNPGLGKVGP